MTDRVNWIIQTSEYIAAYEQIEIEEENREFCRHDMDHFLNVARLAQIDNLRNQSNIEEDLIYAAALLHDIGRASQYREQIPHEEASASKADRIMSECGFSKEERDCVVQAILLHRNREEAMRFPLATVIYRADKSSRPCFFCKASEQCNWDKKKKNLEIRG